MILRFNLFLCCCWFTLHKLHAINILMLEEVASPSHHLWISKLTTALAIKGYNITSLSADVDKNPVQNLHYLHLDKVYDTLNAEGEEFDFFGVGKLYFWEKMTIYNDYFWKNCKGGIESTGWKQLQSYPDDFKFDLVIHDYIFGYCHLAFLQKFNNPPLISLTAFNDIQMLTSNINSVMTPSISTHYTFEVVATTFLERTKNFLTLFSEPLLRWLILHPGYDTILKSVNLSIPPTDELITRSELILVNHDPLIDSPEQLLPNVIGVGGLQIEPAKPLPEDLKGIFENATKGLVLFSLGTNVPMTAIGEERMAIILEALRKLPFYTFLCKFDLSNLKTPSVPANVVLAKWIPQNDVLAHRNTKLFITHSGLLSTQEAIWHGVPMLGMPIFADQFLNIDKSIRKGVAERIYWAELSTDMLYNKIKQLLENPSYAENMLILSKQFRDQKETPLERAVWWIEWKLRNSNTRYLQSPGKKLNLLQLHSIDVIVFLFIIILLTLWIIIKIACSVFLLFFGKCFTRNVPKNKGKQD